MADYLGHDNPAQDSHKAGADGNFRQRPLSGYSTTVFTLRSNSSEGAAGVSARGRRYQRTA